MHRHTRTLLLITLLLFAPARTAQATTIVAVRTPRQIVIGADSKVTDTDSNALDRRPCKIIQAGNLFFAYAGFAFNPQTGYSVSQIARQALQTNPNAPASVRVSILTGAITSRLFDELAYLREHMPDDYRRKIALLEGRPFLKILVAGFEGSTPLLFTRSFQVIASPHRTLNLPQKLTAISRPPRAPAFFGAPLVGVGVTAEDCLADCRGEHVTAMLGETEAIEGLPEDQPNFWTDDLAVGVRRLIELQIAARSDYVGAPIDLLSISPTRALWLQHKPECPDLKPTIAPARPRRRTR